MWLLAICCLPWLNMYVLSNKRYQKLTMTIAMYVEETGFSGCKKLFCVLKMALISIYEIKPLKPYLAERTWQNYLQNWWDRERTWIGTTSILASKGGPYQKTWTFQQCCMSQNDVNHSQSIICVYRFICQRNNNLIVSEETYYFVEYVI